MARIDLERVAQILVDAQVLGSDRKAARKHGVSEKTIWNHRQRLESESELADLYRSKVEAAELQWRCDLVRAMRTAFRRAEALLEKENDLDKITRFLDKTGGVATAREALGVDGPSTHFESPAAAEAAGGADDGVGQGEGGEVPEG